MMIQIKSLLDRTRRYLNSSIEMTSPERVVIDIDIGTDDFLAVLMLLEAEKRKRIKIEAIVCTNGNTTVENVCKNVVRMLEITGRTDIPVYKGASKQLIPENSEIPIFHGSDGFGGLRYDKEPDMSIVKKEPAASAIGNLVLDNPNEITIICVAPLTNLALSIRLHEKFGESIKALWIMGGNYTALGNVTATAEFNFYFDPEAAYIVLESVKKPIFILTWETCLRPTISMKWRLDVFGKSKNPAVQLLTRAEKSVYSENEKNWLPCDAFLALAFIDPHKAITKKSHHNASIELHGSQTRGQVVLDHLKIKQQNITIIEEIDSDFFQKYILEL